jgi:hypothetical protein
VGGEEDVEKIAIRNHGRIECDLHHLGVPGAYQFIIRMLRRPAGISGDHFLYPFQLHKHRLQAPELILPSELCMTSRVFFS